MSYFNFNLEYERQRRNAERDFFRMGHNNREVMEAYDAFIRISRRGSWHRLWSRIQQKPYRLWNLNAILQCQVEARYSTNVHLVPIKAIKGSEGKANAFDFGFHPVHPAQSRERWMAIALAHWQGQSLPPVELILVDDGRSPAYFVRDGHHRISVARAYGQREIEAQVTVWQLASLAPWSEFWPPLQTAVASL